MDIFRSKKRDTESLGDLPKPFEKKHRGLGGSLGDLLDIDKVGHETASDDSDSSDTDIEGSAQISKKQKIFAKKSIKREKKKEKEQRKKVEKNTISMDDFLRKQSEFKMWLYEEKSKNAGDIFSPKLKSLFKQFVRSWNKRKLPQKYYRSLTCPDSPAPLTPKKFNFLDQEDGNKSPLMENPADSDDKEPPKSPFVTFGKTPPKVLRSKKLQLFPASQDVALISVMPIGSPQVVPANKENTLSNKEKLYCVPRHKSEGSNEPEKKETWKSRTPPPVPCKVSVFPWALKYKGKTPSEGSFEICATTTPPSKDFHPSEEQESWPAPPSESEINSFNNRRKNESPHVPPPPPPRLGSRSSNPNKEFPSPPPLSATYSDPYDSLPDPDTKPKHYVSEYQEPVDSVVNTRTHPDDPSVVLRSLGCKNTDKSPKTFSEKREFSKEELDDLYAKPMKRQKKESFETQTIQSENLKSEVFQSELYSEIMEHLSKNKVDIRRKPVEPDYETIDEVMEKIEQTKAKEIVKKAEALEDAKQSKVVDRVKKVVALEDVKINEDAPVKPEPHFAKLSKSKKKIVMAASSDKIYETYLSMGKNVNPFKARSLKNNVKNEEDSKVLKKRYKSQPDISFSEGKPSLKEISSCDEIDLSNDLESSEKSATPFLSSFKPVDVHYTENSHSNFIFEASKYKLSDKAKSYEDGLREVNPPGTPIILATPSFDSLCAVTPLSKKSGSSMSLPTKSESTDNFSDMSTSTSSSLSFAPNDHSGSAQSLHSEKSLSPVLEEAQERENEIADQKNTTPKTVHHAEVSDKYRICTTPITPGKVSAGIDLSVYLLNPNKPVENHSRLNSVTENVQNDNDEAPPLPPKPSKNQPGQKLYDVQSRLAFKDTLSGVKTNLDQSKKPSREPERRATVQTVQELKTSLGQKMVASHVYGSVPVIGIASKNRKFSRSTEDMADSKSKSGRSKDSDVGEDQYLETDIDNALTVVEKQSMQKSTSFSRLDPDLNVVTTEIW